MTQYEAVRIDFLDGTSERYTPYLRKHLITVSENDCSYILMTSGRQWIIPRRGVKVVTLEPPLTPGEYTELHEMQRRERRSWSEMAADFVKEETGA